MQHADILTKALPRDTLKVHRNVLLGVHDLYDFRCSGNPREGVQCWPVTLTQKTSSGHCRTDYSTYLYGEGSGKGFRGISASRQFSGMGDQVIMAIDMLNENRYKYIHSIIIQ